MSVLRDLVEAIPKRLNSLLGPDHSFDSSGFFVHVGDGYGNYPRFRTAARWPDLDQRVATFRRVIAKVPNRWSEFLTWWPAPADAGSIRESLGGDLASLPAADLYEMLLTVMLTTPASWADRDYWLIHQQLHASGEPFLARWEKREQNAPWHLTASCIKEGKIVTIGHADVVSGSLPEDAGHLASIFWEYLYPLCRRVEFNPPQDPAKYATGTFLELILPVRNSEGGSLRGWSNCHLASDSDPFDLLQIFSKKSVMDEWEAIGNEISNVWSL